LAEWNVKLSDPPLQKAERKTNNRTERYYLKRQTQTKHETQTREKLNLFG